MRSDKTVLEAVYGKTRMMVDPETGELFTARPIVGEKIKKEYCIYGSLYKTFYSELCKFEPMVTLHIFNYLMMNSEMNTNKVNTSNVLLQKGMRQSKSSVSRCLKVLREAQVLVKYKNKDGEESEYINPLIWFCGDQAHRCEVFAMLGNPAVVFKDEFYRKEFRINPNDEIL